MFRFAPRAGVVAVLVAVAATALTIAPRRAASAGSVIAPRAYALPARAVTVSTGNELAAALATPRRQTIVLRDGDYTRAGPFANRYGDSLYAEHVGRAVVHAGMFVLRGGATIQGLAFEVATEQRTLHDAVLSVLASDVQVLDTTVDGAMAIGIGLYVASPDGFVGERLDLRHFRSLGVDVSAYPRHVALTKVPELQDVAVADVSRAQPGSSNGTAEACLWFGSRIHVLRASARHCAWMGVWTGFDSARSTYDQLDVDATPTGVYAEHFTTDSTFSRLHVGPDVGIGVNCEWDDPSWGGKPACAGDVVRDSLIESNRIGVDLDEGTHDTSILNTTFRNQRQAAIVDYGGQRNRYMGNHYSGIAAGAVAVTHAHA